MPLIAVDVDLQKTHDSDKLDQGPADAIDLNDWKKKSKASIPHKSSLSDELNTGTDIHTSPDAKSTPAVPLPAPGASASLPPSEASKAQPVVPEGAPEKIEPEEPQDVVKPEATDDRKHETDELPPKAEEQLPPLPPATDQPVSDINVQPEDDSSNLALIGGLGIIGALVGLYFASKKGWL